jgi:WD40 repeat protein
LNVLRGSVKMFSVSDVDPTDRPDSNDCPDSNDLVGFLEGLLSGEASSELEQHLDSCPACRQVLAAMGQASGAPEPSTSPIPPTVGLAPLPAIAPTLQPSGSSQRAGWLFRPDEHIDHFQVIRLLGRGGMGEVYLARDTRLGRRVALKVIHPDCLGSQEVVERFLFEARTTARFNHPHIVTVYAVGEHLGIPYLALEYVEGQTLRQRLQEQRLSVPEAARVGLAMAVALAEAARHQVVHGDLKPANVLIGLDGRPRVLDFGLARLVEGRERTGAPLTRQGTPAYMAPENWCTATRAAEDLAAEDLAAEELAAEDPAAEAAPAAGDVWALGLILHELTTGHHPYEAVGDAELEAAVTGDEPAPLRALDAEDAPPALAELIGRCLSKDPRQRPTPQDAARVLEDVVARRAAVGAEEGSPFRGLLPFDERHAPLFYGREREIAAFLERVRHQAVLAVVGPSGAGKSSFVRAGVIPRLREQGPWVVLKLRPGPRPFEALADQIRGCESSLEPRPVGAGAPLSSRGTPGQAPRRSPGRPDGPKLVDELMERPGQLSVLLHELAELRERRVLLFVDQLEELYTLVDDPQVRRRFMRAVCTAAQDEDDPVRVVLALRDDFLFRLAEAAPSRRPLSRITLLQRPRPEALEQVLTGPLAARGFRFDDEQLPQQIVREVADEAGCLPLLQFAAHALWERRDPATRQLRRADYLALGGVGGALAHHADGVLEELAPGQVQVARRLLLRLIEPQTRTRKVLAEPELLEGIGAEATLVLELLVRRRLLATRRDQQAVGAASVELAHESLISEWGTLARWLAESREDLALIAEVNQAAELWQRRGSRADELWQGAALQEALLDLGRCQVADVPPLASSFLEAGRRRAGARTLRRRAALALILLALALAALVFAVKGREAEVQRQQAEQQRGVAERQRALALLEGARAALQAGRRLEARAKLRGALEVEDSPEGRALWWRLRQDPLLWKRDLGSLVYDATFLPDGRRVALAGQDGTVRLLDLATGAGRALRGHADQVIAVAAAPDGALLASGGWDGEIFLWDLRPDAGVKRRRLGRFSGAVKSLTFSADGRRLAAGFWGSKQANIRIFEAPGGKQQRELSYRANISQLAFSPSGELLASASWDRTARIFDAASGRELRVLRGHTAGLSAVTFSPDGRRLVTGSFDHTVRVWSTDQGQLLRTLEGHGAKVWRLAFRPGHGGRQLASASTDKTVRLWDLQTGRQLLRLDHGAGVWSLALAPDGRRLLSGARDHELRLHDLDRLVRQRAEPLGPHQGSVNPVRITPDGQVVVSGGWDKTIRLWDVKRGQVTRELRGHVAGIYGVDVSPDGKLIVSGGWDKDKTVRLWDLRSGRELAALSGHTGGIYAVRFSPDGKRVASAGWDETIRIWDVGKRRLERVLKGHIGAVLDVAFSPAGELLASASTDATLRLWRVKSGRPQGSPLKGHVGAVRGVAFSPDGRQLASSGHDGTVRIWELAAAPGGRSRIIGRIAGRVYWLAFAPDGRRVGAPCSDGVARIWPVSALTPSTPGGAALELRGHQGEVNHLSFSRDGKLAVTSSDDETVRLWDAVSGRPVWRTTALVASRAGVVLRHDGRGWTALAGAKPGSVSPTAWMQAITGATAAAEQRGNQLCVLQRAGAAQPWALELWALEPAPRRLLATAGDRSSAQVVALRGGCVVRADKETRLFVPGGDPRGRRLHAGATVAAAADGDGLALATRDQVLSFNAAGRLLARRTVDPNVTALARVGVELVLGFRDGKLERLGGSSFEGTPASPVVSVAAGPPGSLIAGHANGELGLWSLRTGARILRRRLHGPARHLLLRGDQLFVATDLGQQLTLSLGLVGSDRCQVLRQIWREVPAVWAGGAKLVVTPPPPDHPCTKNK